jgi:hypothetical protein
VRTRERGGEKGVNRRVLVICVALIALVMLATPVMAIGPKQAAEEGNNPNLAVMFGGVVNKRGAANGTNVWASAGNYSVEWKWRDPLEAKGLMNNALDVINTTLLIQYMSGKYDNKWMFLSGDGAGQPNKYMGHGMLWWFWRGFTNSSATATAIVSTQPNGALFMHQEIYNNMP